MPFRLGCNPLDDEIYDLVLQHRLSMGVSDEE